MNFRLSKPTLGLAAFIVISAAFMLQIRSWLIKSLGEPFIFGCLALGFILAILVTLFYIIKIRLNPIRVYIVFFIFIFSWLFAMWQPYLSEKTHVLTYGLLGFLASRDLIAGGKARGLKDVILAVSFIAFISASDEIFQAFLPYRFGEIRDFITNIDSGLFGLALSSVLKKS